MGKCLWSVSPLLWVSREVRIFFTDFYCERSEEIYFCCERRKQENFDTFSKWKKISDFMTPTPRRSIIVNLVRSMPPHPRRPSLPPALPDNVDYISLPVVDIPRSRPDFQKRRERAIIHLEKRCISTNYYAEECTETFLKTQPDYIYRIGPFLD